MLTITDLYHLKETIEAVEAEFDLLEYDNEWYVCDVSDLVSSSKQILYSALNIEDPNHLEVDDADE